MNIAFSTGLSGLLASTARLDASASNIANAQTRGRVPSSAATSAADAPAAYQPLTTIQSFGPGGEGVSTTYGALKPAYRLEQDTDAPFADAQGMVAAPNVDPVRDLADQILAQRSFEADLATIRTADAMEGSLLDLKA